MKECPTCRRCYPDETNHCPQDGDATAPSLLGEPTLDARYEMLKIRNRDIDWRATPDPILTIQWGNAKSRRKRKIALVSPRVVEWLKSRRAVGGFDDIRYFSTTTQAVRAAMKQAMG